MKEKIYMKLAWFLPKRLIYWCYVRMHSYATTTKQFENKTPDQVTCFDAMEVWPK